MIIIIASKPFHDYLLELSFSNFEARCFDVKAYPNFGIFKELKEVAYFN